MRWLAHRGGALDFRDFALAKPGQPFPIAVALGADPATILGAVTPVPDTLSEYQFAGLLRGSRTEVVDTGVGDAGVMLQVPASAEIVLEGHIPAAATGFDGRQRTRRARRRRSAATCTRSKARSATTPATTTSRTGSRCSRSTRITHRRDPIYHSTYTGKPPDEPAMLGVALNEVFVPILQKQFPEIVDFYLPPEGCSYRMAIVSIRKSYPGHAKRLMFGIWSFLRQFMYTKFIVVTDDDVDIRDWKEVIWAITTRMDPVRDTTLVEQHADRLPRLRLAGQRPGRQDGAGRDQQVARRDGARMGPRDPHGRGRRAACAGGAGRDHESDRLTRGHTIGRGA